MFIKIHGSINGQYNDDRDMLLNVNSIKYIEKDESDGYRVHLVNEDFYIHVSWFVGKEIFAKIGLSL